VEAWFAERLRRVEGPSVSDYERLTSSASDLMDCWREQWYSLRVNSRPRKRPEGCCVDLPVETAVDESGNPAQSGLDHKVELDA
jgi:hypothetical protein